MREKYVILRELTADFAKFPRELWIFPSILFTSCKTPVTYRAIRDWFNTSFARRT